MDDYTRAEALAAAVLRTREDTAKAIIDNLARRWAG